MDSKTLKLIEFPSILEKLSSYAAFSASAELALAIEPSSELDLVQQKLALTREARLLLSLNPDIRVSGARDIRPQVERASRRFVLSPEEINDVKNTLITARRLQRPFFSRLTEEQKLNLDPKVYIDPAILREDSPEVLYPHLVEIAQHIGPPHGLIDRITRTLDENGYVLDNASSALSSIRSEIKVAHSRLMSRLEGMISDQHTMPMLQEAIITQRNGRYVIPLRADFKGRIPSIIHDQSSSGATLFVEPLQVVELNNRWHELQLEERDEIRRILADLSDEIGTHHGAIEKLVASLAEIDLALSCAKYADDLRASEPEVLPYRPAPDGSHPGSLIHLRKARHPLLNPKQVVPVDILLEPPHFDMVITGPNTGGKTVTLKTTGLMIAMAQSGLHIPVESGSKFNIFEDLFADIGDEQSIEQSLSTFSGHINNIVHILNHADSHSLVLFDELGSGTDPQEGAALAHAILAHLTEHQIPAMVATHYARLKNFAYNTRGVVNAAMSFDLETLSPTYHLMIGLPGRSNALLIAERVGLSKEIIDAARETIHPDELQADDLLDDILDQKEKAHQAREAAQRAQREADKMRDELAERLDQIEDERLRILEKAQVEAQDQIHELQKELRELRRRMKRAVRYSEKASAASVVVVTPSAPENLEAEKEEALEGQKRAKKEVKRLDRNAKKIVERVDELMEIADETIERQRHPKVQRQQPRPLQVGDLVYIRSLKKEGTVTEILDSDVEVQLGAMRMKTGIEDVERPKKKSEALTPAEKRRERIAQLAATMPSSTPVYHASPGLELDLRGQRGDEALDQLDRYLERAYLANMPFVRVIHGKGSGTLRQLVRDSLGRHPHVLSWEEAGETEGGSGATVAKLRS